MPSRPKGGGDAGAAGGGAAGGGARADSGPRPRETGPAARARAGEGGRAARRGLERTPEDPFDAWLRDGLQRAFGAVAAEPVPEEILRLIEADRAERERIRRRRAAAARQPGGGEAG